AASIRFAPVGSRFDPRREFGVRTDSGNGIGKSGATRSVTLEAQSPQYYPLSITRGNAACADPAEKLCSNLAATLQLERAQSCKVAPGNFGKPESALLLAPTDCRTFRRLLGSGRPAHDALSLRTTTTLFGTDARPPTGRPVLNLDPQTSARAGSP